MNWQKSRLKNAKTKLGLWWKRNAYTRQATAKAVVSASKKGFKKAQRLAEERGYSHNWILNMNMPIETGRLKQNIRTKPPYW